MLTFAKPSPLHGDNLEAELAVAGYQVDVFDLGDEIRVVGVDESARSAIQTVIDAHSGSLTTEQQKPLTVQSQLETGITQMKNELANWPPDLAAGATLNQVGARVNLASAQAQRNTERLLWLAQKLLNRFE